MVVETLGVLAVGLVLAFAGARIFEVALVLFGAVLGGAAGFGAAEASGESVLLGIVIGAVIGIAIVQLLYVLAVMGPGFLLGAGVGSAVSGSQEIVLLVGVIGAVLAWALRLVAIAAATALIGANLVTSVLSLGGPTALPTLGVAVVGFLSQLGLISAGASDGDGSGSSEG